MLKTFCHLHDEEGIFRFYVGGALGVDMWAAEQLLYLHLKGMIRNGMQ